MPHRVSRNWSVSVADPAAVELLRRELELPSRLARMLVRRGVVTPDAAEEYLEPSYRQLHDPFRLDGMAGACDYVHAALARDELVTLYGDYDVDGTCAAAVLYFVFKKLGARVRIHSPERSEGYGLSRSGIDRAHAAGSRLVVTMDQGVSARQEINYARSLGIDVLVTDHHALPDELPDAVAVLHPDLPGQDYPNPHLCGTAVAFKLGEALLRTSESPGIRD